MQVKNTEFTPVALRQYNEWALEDRKTFSKLARLILEIQRTPFSGSGHPEPLKGDLKGYWSRRITYEHRLVYEVKDEIIVIVSCKYHYDN
jgi:toxin YoeB